MSQNISPLQPLHTSWLEKHQVNLFLKRDDLLGGACQGNKFRKLKYLLRDATEKGFETILTFGGAFSNHLFAVAATGAAQGFKTIGIVRGEIDNNNPTIKALQQWDMTLQAEDRSAYRLKGTQAYLDRLRQQFPHAYIIPEGGHSELAIEGVHEMVDEVRNQLDQPIHHWCCSMATGSTVMGIGRGLLPHEKLHAFATLKGIEHAIVQRNIAEQSRLSSRQVAIYDAYLNGFARRHPAVEAFIEDFYRQHGIILDPIYTSKMMYRLFALIKSGSFQQQTIVAIHTGGTQGNAGYNYRYGSNLPEATFAP